MREEAKNNGTGELKESLRKCYYCGEGVDRQKSNYGEKEWMARERVYCSHEHYSLSRRIEVAPTEMLIYMLDQEITIKELREACNKYFDEPLSMPIFVGWINKGIGPFAYGCDGRYKALRVTKALLDLDTQALLDKDIEWDYRRLLVRGKRPWSYVESEGKSKSVIRAFLDKHNIDLLDLLYEQRNGGGDGLRDATIIKNSLERIARDRGITSYYGEWERILKNGNQIGSSMAYRISDLLSVCGLVEVDYRSLLNVVRPHRLKSSQIKLR